MTYTHVSHKRHWLFGATLQVFTCWYCIKLQNKNSPFHKHLDHCRPISASSLWWTNTYWRRSFIHHSAWKDYFTRGELHRHDVAVVAISMSLDDDQKKKSNWFPDLELNYFNKLPKNLESFPQRCSVLAWRPGWSLALSTVWMNTRVTPLLLFSGPLSKQVIILCCFI